MKTPLVALTLFIGVILAVHLAMNGKVGAAIGNPRVGNALFWCIGAVGALAIGASGWQSGALDGLKDVNPLLLTAGLMGACLVFGIAWLIPQVGASAVMFGMIAGQIVAGMVMSHCGLLGSPLKPISMMNIAGAIALMGGVYLGTR
jgi:transporter family-2 protein